MRATQRIDIVGSHHHAFRASVGATARSTGDDDVLSTPDLRRRNFQKEANESSNSQKPGGMRRNEKNDTGRQGGERDDEGRVGGPRNTFSGQERRSRGRGLRTKDRTGCTRKSAVRPVGEEAARRWDMRMTKKKSDGDLRRGKKSADKESHLLALIERRRAWD